MVISAVLLCYSAFGVIEQHTILVLRFKKDAKNKRESLTDIICESLNFVQQQIDRRDRLFKGATYMTDHSDAFIEELQKAIHWNRSRQNIWA